MQPPEAPVGWRVRVFAATWVSYFSYYFTRKPFSATKSDLKAEFQLSDKQLNWIDTTYNIAYCVGQFTNGVLVEKIGARRWVALGMLASAALCFTMQAAESLPGTLMGVYMLVWGLNGFAQSTGWPGNGKLMAEWYGTRRRGEVMGYWSTCYQAGGLVASLLAAELLERGGWRAVYVGPAIWVLVVALAFAILVRDRPSQIGYADPDTAPGLTREERRALARAELPRVLRTPMVWVMGLCYFCLKSIRYSFLFWLPLFLHESFAYSKADSVRMSMAFEAGGIVLVIVGGLVADRVFARRRVLTAFVFLWMLVGGLALYREVAAASALQNALALALVGGCLFAADSLVSGAVAQDLGGPHAAGLAAGMINGIGSIGQVLQGFVLVYVKEAYGWSAVFPVFMGLAAAGALCLIPYLRVGPAPTPTPTPSIPG